MEKQNRSPLIFTLKALIPYSKQNMLLAYKPSQFFNELEKTSNRSRSQLQTTISKAIKSGYVDRVDGVPRLTEKGRRKIRPYVAKKLGNEAFLVVTFDIPEVEADKRKLLRRFLKMRDFKLVQRSVWSTKMDHREELLEFIEDIGVADCVDIYESVKLNP